MPNHLPGFHKPQALLKHFKLELSLYPANRQQAARATVKFQQPVACAYEHSAGKLTRETLLTHWVCGCQEKGSVDTVEAQPMI